MESLANVVAISGGTGTVAATINFANVVCKVFKLPLDIAQNRLIAMIKNPEQLFYHNLRYSPFAISADVSQTTVARTPFVGNIVGLYFVKRPSGSLTQDSAYQFTAILNFALVN